MLETVNKSEPNLFSRNYGLFIFAVFGICFIPFVLYLINVTDFGYDFYLLTIPVLLAIIVFLFVFLIRFIFNFSKKTNNYIQLLLSYLGLTIFLNDLLVPTQAKSLDGTLNQIPEPVFLTIIEIFIAACLLVLVLKYTKIKSVFIEISKYSVAIFVLFILVVIYTGISKNNIEINHIVSSNQTGNKGKKPNVYIIWLDGMQSDYFQTGVEELKLADEFQGFTQFVNNMSNYLYSWHSYKSFFSSTFYDGIDFDKWKSDDKLRHILKSEGYQLTAYGRSDFLSDLDDTRILTNDIYKIVEGENTSNPYVVDFVSLSLVKMSPNFLANEVLDFGTKLGETINELLFSKVETDVNKNINSVNKGMYPFMSTLLFKKGIEDEKQRMSHNEFVLLQAIIPHPPYVLDRECKFLGVRKNKSNRKDKQYYDQVLCGITLTIEFLQELKKQGKYNDSVIVVLGDHGNGTTDLLRNKDFKRNKQPVNKNYSKWNEGQLFARTKALLMIKPVNSKNFNLKYSKRESQHIDILPTILDLIGISGSMNSDFKGISLFSKVIPNRESLMFYFKPQGYYDMKDAEIYEVEFDENTLERTGLRFYDKFKP